MELDIDVIAKLLAPTISAAGLIVKKLLEKRPKLITYMVHSSAIPLGDEKKHKHKLPQHCRSQRRKKDRQQHTHWPSFPPRVSNQPAACT